MGSSRNEDWDILIKEVSCNRLENAVKPQHIAKTCGSTAGCNRLENAVKPQHPRLARLADFSCNRLENAVKPQVSGRAKRELFSWYRNRKNNKTQIKRDFHNDHLPFGFGSARKII